MRIVKFLGICSIFLLQMIVGAQEVKQELNLSKSYVKWIGRKVMGSHHGTLHFKKGSFTFKGKELVSGEFVVDMTTLQVTDLQGDGKINLENHLKDSDFFGVDKYKESHLKITKVKILSKSSTSVDYAIRADLTIKNITKPVEFTMHFTGGGNATAKLTIDRTQYGIKYNSKSFFSGLGDKVIYDDFEIQVKLVGFNH